MCGIRLWLAKTDEDFSRKGVEMRRGEVEGREGGAVRKGDGGLASACGTERVLRGEGCPIGRICGGRVAPRGSALLFCRARFGRRGNRGS